jgi:hypothetical protein
MDEEIRLIQVIDTRSGDLIREYDEESHHCAVDGLSVIISNDEGYVFAGSLSNCYVIID